MARIVIEVKFIDPQPKEIAQASVLLAEQVLQQHGIRIQVEFLQDRVLLFWYSRQDFNQTMDIFRAWRVVDPAAHSPEGAIKRWEFRVVRAVNEVEGLTILETFCKIINDYCGGAPVAKILGSTIHASIPLRLQFFTSLQQHYKVTREGLKVPSDPS